MYIRTLEEGLLDALHECEDVIGHPLFHQDSAKIHIAAHITQCLEEHGVA